MEKVTGPTDRQIDRQTGRKARSLRVRTRLEDVASVAVEHLLEVRRRLPQLEHLRRRCPHRAAVTVKHSMAVFHKRPRGRLQHTPRGDPARGTAPGG
jgi:hypothetical protein